VATAVISTCSSFSLDSQRCLALAHLVDAGVSQAKNLSELQNTSDWVAVWAFEESHEDRLRSGSWNAWNACAFYDNRGRPKIFDTYPGKVKFVGPSTNKESSVCLELVPPIVGLMALLLEETTVLTGQRNYISFAKSFHDTASVLESALVQGVQNAFDAADEHCSDLQNGQERRSAPPTQHNLEELEFAMEGMAGDANRVLMNVLAAEVNAAWSAHEQAQEETVETRAITRGIRYLEVGSYKGSSLAATICGNLVARAVSVDDFSEFQGSYDVLAENVKRCEDRATWVGKAHGIEFEVSRFQESHLYDRLVRGTEASSDGWSLEEDQERFELYLYDGPHAEQDHFDAVNLVAPRACRRLFVLVVDDWNWEHVRYGTRRGLAGSNLSVLFEASATGADWHNGCWVAVVRQK